MRTKTFSEPINTWVTYVPMKHYIEQNYAGHVFSFTLCQFCQICQHRKQKKALVLFLIETGIDMKVSPLHSQGGVFVF